MKKRTEQHGVLAVFLFLAFTTVGAAILVYVSEEYRSAARARTVELEAVVGELREVALETVSSPTGQATAYRVNAEYAYTYNGEPFIGTRIGYGRDKWETRLSASEAKAIVEELEARDPFLVHVERNDPGQAVLISDATGIIGLDTIFVTAFGAVFLAVGLWSVGVAILSLRRG